MNELQIFSNPEFGEIKGFEIGGEAWFIGSYIARALGYVNPHEAVRRHVDEDDCVFRSVIDKLGREQSTKLINESGLYTLIIMSDLPNAKKFKRWVTKEVIPSVINTGSYNLPQLSQTELIAQIAQNNVELEKRISAVEQKIQESEEKFKTTLQTFSAPGINHWKASVDNNIKRIVETNRLSLVNFRGKLYKELETTGNVNLQNRVTRLKNRLKKQGAAFREREAVTKLDAISRDKNLRLMFEHIVEKYETKMN